MKLRAPAYPLINVDPNFNIWSMGDKLNEQKTKHWTEIDMPIDGIVIVDGKSYRFMGTSDDAVAMEQKSVDINAFTTTYNFSCDGISLKAEFTTPLLLGDLNIASRPVSYIRVSAEANDGKGKDIKIQLTVDDAICLNCKMEHETIFETVSIPNAVCGKMGNSRQKLFGRFGDHERINWGYVYAATNAKNAIVEDVPHSNEYGTKAHKIKLTVNAEEALFALAYDDIRSIKYFGKELTSYWNKDGKKIETAIAEALADYDSVMAKCQDFDAKLKADCKGNEKYHELLLLAYRQAIGSHKIAVDDEGNILFISKECFSGGFTTTVDVTYPSIPLFLLYNPELVKGMLRPVFKYAASDEWFYEFAPHDTGLYPIVGGQMYSNGTAPNWQMPVEECGNMLVATTAVAVVENNVDFAKENWTLLKQWCEYLIKNGLDPNNQLCTDDFAGHLAHNCNLAIKAIMGIASFAILNKLKGNNAEYERYLAIAKDMAGKWIENASDGNGGFKLAFDQEASYSMKYNAVWDMLFGTNLFGEDTFQAEIKKHIKEHTNKYGLVLDNRAKYTKSDWIMWTATMCQSEEDFTAIISHLWDAYNESETRVPMTDWFDTETAKMVGFQNRTVQGGLFIRLLKDKGLCKVDK